MAGDNPTYQELNTMFWDSVRIIHEQRKEIDSLKEQLARTKSAALTGMAAAKAISSEQLEQARKLHAESNPAALESERAMNATLTEENIDLREQIDVLKHTYNLLFYSVQDERENFKRRIAELEEYKYMYEDLCK